MVVHEDTSDALTARSYEYRATGVLGNKREPMLINELHARPQLAKPLQRGYAVPENHTFGLTYDSVDGGVPEALRYYQPGDALYYRSGGEKIVRDFVGLNRDAVAEGLVTSKEHTLYRASHDKKKREKKRNSDQWTTSNTPEKPFIPRRIPPNMVFGLATRPSTPLFDLLEHKYQDKWIQERQGLNKQYREEKEVNKSSLKNPYQTRATLLRQYQIPAAEKPLWKLPSFDRHALPRINSNNGPFRKEHTIAV